MFSGSLAFVLTGYALAFGEGNAFLGHTYFAAIDLPRSKFTHLFFQVRRSFISIHLIPPHEKWNVFCINPLISVRYLIKLLQAAVQYPLRKIACPIDISNDRYLSLQGTFAATCATIVSGAIAERCHFNGYIIFSTVMTGLLYPIPAHWCWAEGGWLRELGFRDFAGSSVVHMSGGICALVGECTELDRTGEDIDLT